MKRLVLIANPDRPDALEALEELAAWLDGRAEVVGRVTDAETPLPDVEADAVVAFGGDGTILETARRMGGHGWPVLGINLGRLGYLAEVSRGHMLDGVAALLEDRAEIVERMMLECHAGRETSLQSHALNDILVATASGRIVDLDVAINGRPLASFRGDGLLVATPTGSTAHSLSAGGPILAPTLRAVVLTPVCPHELAIRPLVVSDTEIVSVVPTPESAPVRVCIDGRELAVLRPGERADIRASRRVFRLVQMPDVARYDILRQKLGWGGRRCDGSDDAEAPHSPS